MARVKKVLNKNTGNYVTYDVVTENYDNVKSVMDSYVEECNAFNTDVDAFFSSQKEFLSTTGRNAYGEVDSNDALSSNVIEEIDNMVEHIVNFEGNVISFDEQAKSSAKEKDEEETENNKKSAIRQDNNNVLY